MKKSESDISWTDRVIACVFFSHLLAHMAKCAWQGMESAFGKLRSVLEKECIGEAGGSRRSVWGSRRVCWGG